MAEKKLGPNATYQPEDKEDKTPVTMGGVVFIPGKRVNLEELLGEQGAAAMAKRLAGNRFFKVDGGPDHEAMAKARSDAEKEADKAKEEARKAEADQAAKEAAKPAEGKPVMESSAPPKPSAPPPPKR